MGFLNSIKEILVKTGESIAESQDRKNLKNKTKKKILQRFSVKQLKSLCYRYGGGPADYQIDPFNGNKTKITLSALDYVNYADFQIRLDEVKAFAIANKISISDIMDEEKRHERELNKKWDTKKSKTKNTEPLEDDLFKKVINTIEQFEPSRIYRDEQGYHNELQGWVKAHFRSATVEHQTGSSRPDIVIDTKIAIEVKGPTRSKDLATIADKCNRYTLHYDHLIVVLFEVDVNERHYNEWLKGILVRYPEVEIIRK